MAAPSASSSTWLYDVFLNFRGEDTRNTFTGHLYNALDDAGIHTFIDDDKLRTGLDIGPELLSAIQRSRISIPIFSKNHASSKWCLNELVKIVECRKTMNQLVLPIFYDVDPSDVRNHTASYAEAFQEHGERFHQRIIDEWKEALREVGALKGWDLKNIANRHEGKLVKLVLAEVSSKLRKDSQIVFDDLVGIQSHVEKMMSVLNVKSEDVKIVGVRGLGGIGKTTIAKVVYNTISHHFEGCSFLADVRETSQHYRGLIDLQNQLVSNILKGENLKITNVDEGINVIRERLCRKKVLIILDDVDENFQLDAFMRKREWFGLGSRIVITTRNGHILVNHEVDEIYEPNEMNANQSLQLFSRHAFRRDQTPEDFLDLSKDIVKITGGLPLALEVIGSSLFGMRKQVWRDTLKMLQEIPNDKVQKKLKISFDGLSYLEKEIFLDIACFFIGMDKTIACFIWQQCNFYPEIGIEGLCQKSLVKIGQNNELKMHDQLKDLGKEIIRQENLKVPGERSRLWSHKEALDVLQKQTVAKNLKVLNLTGCQCLSKTPKLGNHCLEVLIVENCVNLVEYDESINFLERLVTLNMRGCTKLRDLPYEIWGLTSLKNLNLHQCESLNKLPDSIGHLENLETFDASFCYIKDGGIPNAIGWLSSLEVLRLGGNDFQGLPATFSSLSSLHTLDLRFCNN